MATTDSELSFEQALEKLDDRLKALEEGKLSLEETLVAVEQARDYFRICQNQLESAKQRIEVRPEPEPAVTTD
ncbi:MAG TPA: exodeoxyribonuclease VII small subunit [Candidatus Dormibacteraeota bacterium]|nr:exodeoxyribonuclease VII small subunit [Candidatus Dormibacteraeota bacterium]